MWDPYQASEDVDIDEHTARNIGSGGSERHATVVALPPASSGKRYFEIIVEKNRGGIHIGWMSSSATSKKPNFNLAIGDTSYSWAIDSYQISKGHNKLWQPFGIGVNKLRQGSVIGCAIDFSSGSIFYWIDGKSLGAAFKDIQTKDTVFFPAVSLKGRKTAVKGNFGQLKFAHPLPVGFSKLELLAAANGSASTYRPSEPSPLSLIPDEVMLCILSHLRNPIDLRMCLEVSRRFRHVALDDQLWKQFEKQKFSGEMRRYNMKGHRFSIESSFVVKATKPNASPLIVTCGGDPFMKVWDLKAKKLLNTYDTHEDVNLVGSTSSGERLIAANRLRSMGRQRRNLVQIWDSTEAACLFAVAGNKNGVHHLACAANNFATASRSLLLLYSYEGVLLHQLQRSGSNSDDSDETEHARVTSLCFVDCAVPGQLKSSAPVVKVTRLVAGYSDGVAVEWNFESGEVKNTYQLSEAPIKQMLVNAEYVVIAGPADEFCIYNTANECSKVELDSHITCMKFISERWICVGLDDGSVAVYSCQSADMIREFAGHRRGVIAMDVSAIAVLTASHDCTCIVWDISSGTALRTVEFHDTLTQVYLCDATAVLVHGAVVTALEFRLPTSELLHRMRFHYLPSLPVWQRDTAMFTK